MNKENAENIEEARGLVKASARYSEKYGLRALIQAIPYAGGSLDTLFSGAGVNFQYRRLQTLVEEISQRMQQLSGTGKTPVTEPSEELYDFIVTVMDCAVRACSLEKIGHFACIAAKRFNGKADWDQATDATRLLSGLSDAHIAILAASLTVAPCGTPFGGLRVITLEDIAFEKMEDQPPTNISDTLSDYPLHIKQFYCSELLSRGLLRDEGLGRYGTRPGGLVNMCVNKSSGSTSWQPG